MKPNLKVDKRQMWWHTPVITALRRLRQEDHEFEVSLGYVVKCCVNKKKRKEGERRERERRKKERGKERGRLGRKEGTF
jgi:hypothetical protein